MNGEKDGHTLEKGGQAFSGESAVADRSLSARLRNPLDGIPRETLLANVQAFAQEKGLTEHTDDLIKGAIVAQNPNAIDTLDTLTDDERHHLMYEKEHRWHHPTLLYMTILLAAIGAATRGWDQTGSNGANLSFPQEFGIAPIEGQPDYVRNTWLVGIVNAGPYLGSVGLGCWLADPLNNWFGRRGCIFITAVVLVATPIGSAFTHSWQELFVVRIILGLGMGAKGATVPIFAAENSPAAIRGALVMGWQLWTAFGIFAGFAANAAVAKTGDIAWRLQIGSAFIPALPLMLFILFLPESPRWLMKKNRYPQALRSLIRLRFSKLQACRDLYYIHVQLVEERKAVRAANFFVRFGELFTVPRLRRATIASGTVMLAQQMCGINIIAFYSSTVFVQSGLSDLQALYASLGFGAINWLFAFPALYAIDTFGRRNLLLSTFPNMAWTLLAAGMCFFIDPSNPDSKTRLALVALFIYIFAMFYSVGEGPVPFAYSAEVFPLSHREVGMAWAVSVCLGFAAVLTISFPRLEAAITVQGAFGFYCGLNIAAFFLIFHLVPETKQLTLEELDQVFSVPHHQFVRYQYKKFIPYFVHKYVPRKKNVFLAPLFLADDDMVGPASSDYTLQHGQFHHHENKDLAKTNGVLAHREKVGDGSSAAAAPGATATSAPTSAAAEKNALAAAEAQHAAPAGAAQQAPTTPVAGTSAAAAPAVAAPAATHSAAGTTTSGEPVTTAAAAPSTTGATAHEATHSTAGTTAAAHTAQPPAGETGIAPPLSDDTSYLPGPPRSS